MLYLKNKAALIIGLRRGIGAKIAKAFGSGGCKVIANYHQNKEQVESTAASIEQPGGKALPYQADVTDTKLANQMVEVAISKLNPPTILTNNTFSPIISKTIFKTDWKEFLSCFEMAVKFAYNCMIVVTPAMRKLKRGKLISIFTQYVHNAMAIATYLTAKYASHRVFQKPGRGTGSFRHASEHDFVAGLDRNPFNKPPSAGVRY